MDYTDLKRIAEAATPGPWKAHCRDVGCADDNYKWNGEDHSGLGWEIHGGDGQILPEPMRGMLDRGHDAAFIATFDPPTVLRLIALAKLAERSRDLLDEVDTTATWNSWAAIGKLRDNVNKWCRDYDEATK